MRFIVALRLYLLTTPSTAGLSSSLSDQLKQILEVVGTGLRGVNTSYRKHHESELKEQHVAELRKADEARVQRRIDQGIWHDGRLDCIAGNGIMSELGVGDELFGENDADDVATASHSSETQSSETEKGDGNGNGNGSSQEVKRKQRSAEDLQAIEAMPVVVLRNFETKGGSEQREALMNVLSQWAATLAENQVRRDTLIHETSTEYGYGHRSHMSSSSVIIARTPSFLREVQLP